MSLLIVKKTRICMIISGAGGGHLSAARAVIRCFEAQYPDQYEFRVVDIEDITGPLGKFFGIILRNTYNFALQSGHHWLEPVLDKLTYGAKDTFMALGCAAVKKFFTHNRPDLLVSMLHGPMDLVQTFWGQGEFCIPTAVVVTDAVSLRPTWVHPKVDAIIVSTQEAHEACVGFGIQESRIHVLGHPIDHRFATPPGDISHLYRKYSLSPDLFTIMILMGGTGGKNIHVFSRMLEKMDMPIQVVACCGTDRRLLKRMQKLASRSAMRICALGFTTEIPELMTLSDLLITKPGPGSIMEAMARDLPMVIDDCNYTLSQEVGNVDYVKKYRLGHVIQHVSELPDAVRAFLENPAYYQHCQINIRNMKKEHSTYHIVAHLRRMLDQG